jgi:hypothetical protein
MVIRLTLVGLLIVLVVVIAGSYYMNKECFENMSTPSSYTGPGIVPTLQNGKYTLQLANSSTDPKVRGIIRLFDNTTNTTLWSVPTTLNTDSSFNQSELRANGEWVLHNLANDEIVWSSKSADQGTGPYTLALDNSGNLTIKDSTSTIIWSQHNVPSVAPIAPASINQCQVGPCSSMIVSKGGLYNLILHNFNGILELFNLSLNGKRTKVWSITPNDNGKNGPYALELTSMGILVIKDANKNVVWNSSSLSRPAQNGSQNFMLMLNDDGTLTIMRDGQLFNTIQPSSGSSTSSDNSDSSDDSWTPSGRSRSSRPQRNDVNPDVSVSDSGYTAMALHQQTKLLKDMQKIIRNELIANRQTNPIDTDSNDTDSNAMAQGKEFGCQQKDPYRCPKNPDGSCPPVPDMTQYIKKDSIPCWGCTPDY